jgi:hypothetical protein|tara:strand:- start:302 stop:457 length:156 start_codon:yes stop_codon:yes gene_type:complete
MLPTVSERRPPLAHENTRRLFEALVPKIHFVVNLVTSESQITAELWALASG